MEQRQLTECFYYYKDIPPQVMEQMAEIREHFINLGEMLTDELPNGRVKSLCFTHLEDALMRAIQALAMQHGVREAV